MPDLLLDIAVSACLGALIGLIRQWAEQSDDESGPFAGVRTHTLWAVLGCLGAFASATHVPFALPVLLLAITAHLVAQTFTHPPEARPGSTSVAGTLLTILCGGLVYWDEMKSAVLVAAATMVMLGVKKPLHRWTERLNDRDIRATLQFVAVSGVILPLVPNRDIGPYDAFNPYSTWLMVVLISGLGFAGYVAMRLLGAGAGILLTGVLGGLASSTASTLAFSRRSREQPELSDHYALAVVAACTVMLPRVLVATGIVNRGFALTLILPFALLALPGVAYAAWMWLRGRSRHRKQQPLEIGNPLNLSTAMKFAALYAAVAFMVTLIREKDWTAGLLPLSFVSGLTDMIAISLSVARDYAGREGAELATRAVILAAVSNTLLKAGMAVALGSAGLKIRVAIVLGLTAAIGIGLMFLAPQLPDFGGEGAEPPAKAERTSR